MIATQLTLEDAIEAVNAHANDDWKKIALDKVWLLCETRATFTADDFWKRWPRRWQSLTRIEPMAPSSVRR